MKKGLWILAIALAAIASWSCKDEISGPDINSIVFPDTNVSYTQQVQPLFNVGCALSGCHSASTYEIRGFSLDDYQHFVGADRPGLVVPMEPDASVLVQRIEGTSAGARMPLNRPPLNQNQIHGIRQWILEGARLN
jgi:hypothetical protein